LPSSSGIPSQGIIGDDGDGDDDDLDDGVCSLIGEAGAGMTGNR